MHLLLDLMGFAFRIILITAAILLILSVVLQNVIHPSPGPRIVVRKYAQKLEKNTRPLRQAALSKTDLKRYFKSKKAEQKARKSRKGDKKPRLWVLSFKGDIQATEGQTLKDEITAVLQVCEPTDSVMIRINSTGGSVVGYGLVAAHLDRFRKQGLRLTAAVDEAAASGGYLMAAVADEILAAPFSVIGSIGVIATIPNARKLLEDKGIEVMEFTAGEYKRTVTPFSEVTEARRQKLIEQLSDIHTLFKEYVAVRRPSLSIDEVATGEYWYGTRAVEKGLADRLITSDEWLLEQLQDHEIYLVHTLVPGMKIAEKLHKLQAAAKSMVAHKWTSSPDEPTLPQI